MIFFASRLPMPPGKKRKKEKRRKKKRDKKFQAHANSRDGGGRVCVCVRYSISFLRLQMIWGITASIRKDKA